MIDNIQLY